jgi:hypothetical protein
MANLAWAHSPSPKITGPTECGIEVDSAKELEIINPLVVDSARAQPGGVWHMASLLKQMLPTEATNADLSNFILKWLNDAKAVKELNGFALPFPGQPLGERNVCAWINETGGKNDCTATSVDPDRLPYRLVAIVNRLDLNGHNVDQAEGRFVFAGLKNPPETVIFEYHLPLKSPADLTAWAKAWHELGAKSCTTNDDCESYRVALEALTQKFSSRGVAPGRPNGNAIGQIRTSHLAPGSGTLWSFRQFELTGEGKSAAIVSTPTSQTPDGHFDNEGEFADLLTKNRTAVLAESFVVPNRFLAPEAILDDAKSTQWELRGTDATLRASFSQQTCNGCHGETEIVDGFFHVSPVRGTPDDERLSPFLKAQLPKRAAFMKQLLCASQTGGKP